MKKIIISPVLVLSVFFLLLTACDVSDSQEADSNSEKNKAVVIAEVMKCSLNEVTKRTINSWSETITKLEIYEIEGIETSFKFNKEGQPVFTFEFDDFLLSDQTTTVNGTLTVQVFYPTDIESDKKAGLILNTPEDEPIIFSSTTSSRNFTLELCEVTLYYNLSPLGFMDQYGITGTIVVNGIPLDLEAIAGLL